MNRENRKKEAGAIGIGSCLGLLFAATLLMVGCSEGESSQVIGGKVTFQGAPVTEGDVSFSNAATGRVALSPLDAEGKYQLLLTRPLLAGEYRVTVTPTVTYKKMTSRGGTDLKMIESGGKSIPIIFRNSATSRLRATVTGGEDIFDFELKK